MTVDFYNWDIILTLQQDKEIKMRIIMNDSTTIKMHRHGGGQKGGVQSRGRSISGITTKFHLAMTGDRHVVEGFLSWGNIADISVVNELFSGVYGCYILEDNGHDSDAHREFLRSQNNVLVISWRRNRRVKIV